MKSQFRQQARNISINRQHIALKASEQWVCKRLVKTISTLVSGLRLIHGKNEFRPKYLIGGKLLLRLVCTYCSILIDTDSEINSINRLIRIEGRNIDSFSPCASFIIDDQHCTYIFYIVYSDQIRTTMYLLYTMFIYIICYLLYVYY